MKCPCCSGIGTHPIPSRHVDGLSFVECDICCGIGEVDDIGDADPFFLDGDEVSYDCSGRQQHNAKKEG